MNKYGGDIFANPIYEIDSIRNNVNRIMNPSIHYCPGNDQNAAGQGIQGDDPASGIKNDTGPVALYNPSDTINPSDTVKARGAAGGAITGSSTGTSSAAGQTNKRYSAAPTGKPVNINADNAGFKLEFTGSSLMNGIILAELLGKPKYLQKRRL